MYIKQDLLKKDSNCPVSLLPHVSKIFEHIEVNSKYITGFQKYYGTQHSLITVLDKWENVLNKGEYVCMIFMDLWKAFDK